MKNKNIIFFILLSIYIFSCKKDGIAPPINIPVITHPVAKVCNYGFYGKNCDSSYTILFAGKYKIHDSCVANRTTGVSMTTIKIINTHDANLFDSAGYLWCDNFWGQGERMEIIFYNKDTLSLMSGCSYYDKKTNLSWPIYLTDKPGVPPLYRLDSNSFCRIYKIVIPSSGVNDYVNIRFEQIK